MEPLEPVMPDYAGPNVMHVVPALLGVRPVDWLPGVVGGARVSVLLVLDGLGWDAVVHGGSRLPELSALEGRSISTVAPSTTPAALTSITTGLPPGRHGMVGYRIRIEQSVLNTIRWHQENGRRPPDPAAVQRNDVFAGRPVPVVTKSEFRTSGFTAAHLRGTEFHGWPTPAVLVEHVRALVGAGAPFVYAYYPGIDEVAHAFGVEGSYFAAEVVAADRLVGALRDALPGDAVLLVTADHGQVGLGPDSWIGLGALDGMVGAYAGDARFRYLYARSGSARDLLAAAEEVAGAHGWVFSREQLFDEGWLGPEPLGAARSRVGDVILAARDAVGFVDPTYTRETRLRSAHGSLTRAEIEVPLLAGRGRA